MKIQLDINEQANTTLKVISAKQKIKNIRIVGAKVLEDACEMIEETGNPIKGSWEDLKKCEE